MASTISSPVWSGPVPIRKSSAPATAMPEHHAADELEGLAAALALGRRRG
jgi:hypothetical protein